MEIFRKYFEISGETFAMFWRKKKSKSNFSGGGGRLSVRAVQKHAYFLVSRHMAFCQAEFWAGLKSCALGLTRAKKCESFVMFWRKTKFKIQFFWRWRTPLGPSGPKQCLFSGCETDGFLPGGILGGSEIGHNR